VRDDPAVTEGISNMQFTRWASAAGLAFALLGPASAANAATQTSSQTSVSPQKKHAKHGKKQAKKTQPPPKTHKR
jgi:hypothetical protein